MKIQVKCMENRVGQHPDFHIVILFFSHPGIYVIISLVHTKKGPRSAKTGHPAHKVIHTLGRCYLMSFLVSLELYKRIWTRDMLVWRKNSTVLALEQHVYTLCLCGVARAMGLTALLGEDGGGGHGLRKNKENKESSGSCTDYSSKGLWLLKHGQKLIQYDALSSY